jgi:hypothetical protein
MMLQQVRSGNEREDQFTRLQAGHHDLRLHDRPPHRKGCRRLRAEAMPLACNREHHTQPRVFLGPR